MSTKIYYGKEKVKVLESLPQESLLFCGDQLIYYKLSDDIKKELGELMSDVTLVYTYKSEETIECDGPDKIFEKRFEVIVKIADDVEHASRGALLVATSSEVEHGFGSTIFNGEFFTYLPDDLDKTDCHGLKCRIDPNEKGVWCVACNGELESIDDIEMLMHKKISLRNISKESILGVIVKKEPIDLKKDHKKVEDHINAIQQDMDELKNNIDDIPEKIKKFIASMEEEKKLKEKQIKDKINSIQGSEEILKMIEQIKDGEQEIEMQKKKALKKEKLEKLKKKQEELEKEKQKLMEED